MRRLPVAVVVALLAVPTVGTQAPAGAVTSSFVATCDRLNPPAPVTKTTRTISYEVHAPDRVEAATPFDVRLRFAYAVPANAELGGAIIDTSGAIPSSDVIGTPGTPEIAATWRISAFGAPGSVAELRVRQLVGLVRVGGLLTGEVCTPQHSLVLARIGVGVPLVSIGDAAVVEGSSGTRALEFPVSLSRPAATNVTVALATEDGTATAGADYVAASGSITIPAGLSTAVAHFRVRGDTVAEPKENLRVRLRTPVGAAIGRAIGTGRIIDDDPERGPRISIGDSSVVEGNRGTRSARFVVTLSEPAPQDVHFHYVTGDGGAVAGSDYRTQDSDDGIPAGHTSISVPVPVVPDAEAEVNERFTVRLTGATGAAIGRATGVGRIIDDD